ncbi:hypothetical protein KR222_010754 [Zaprionus bogoriensis]|nr:hypothetical protein KR222_010754 [Zaprionus bogoriensis]
MSSCAPTTCTRKPSKTKETARIVIIGSGPAGIAAATRLLEQGFRNVTIFEAENRIGGRINTIPFGDNVVDLGAQWCHGEKNNVVYEMVKDLNLVEKTGEDGMQWQFVRSNKEVLSPDLTSTLRKIAEGSVPEGAIEHEGSWGDILTQRYWEEVNKLKEPNRKIAKEVFENFKKGQCSLEGSDHMFEVSGRVHLEFEDSDGDQLIHWRNNGYKSFLRLLMKSKPDQPEDLGVLSGRVQLNKRVAQINWEGADELLLRCWNGEVLLVDHVICTVSLGVLKEQHEQLFVPRLPAAKLRAINALKLGTVNKFLLEYAVQPLSQEWSCFVCLWRDEDLEELRGSKYFWLESVFGFHTVMYQPRLVEGWIIGEHARYMETLPEEQVLEGLQWLFRKFLSFDMPPPQHFLRTQWHSNPNFRGSYSFRTTYADELRTGPWELETPLLDEEGKPRLQFAGEASSKSHHSTVHGATETGWREADRLNNYYSVHRA